MKSKIFSTVVRSLVVFIFISATPGRSTSVAEETSKYSNRLEQSLKGAQAGDHLTVWVFFRDKGTHELLKRNVPLDVVSPRALKRRARSMPADRLVDYSDLPVEQSYLNAVVDRGAHIRHTSKWFNAVSIEATPLSIVEIAALPFVSSLDLVFVMRRPTVAPLPQSPASTGPGPIGKTGSNQVLDYGPSLAQVSLENIPAVHATGNSAQGIIIGMFDNGFRLLNHEAFDSLRSRIIAQHDFVDHKESVVPDNPSAAFGGHGVSTLSTIAGYKPGQIIGPAYGASFILARTENDSSETPIEEDNWASAIEWAESLGVDVSSTSLGYSTYDPPYTSWTWENMDGKTTLITRAAVMAARKGVIVVNSAGNEGITRFKEPNSLIAPADADSILSVGAVTPDGTRAGFSSVGPTVDGRIKPDVMAVGTNVYVADPTVLNGYDYSQGTSFSCPLTAGVAALLLRAHPAASAMEIIRALKATASEALNPNSLDGWGVIDAVAAINYLENPPIPGSFSLSQNYPNPFNSETHIAFTLSEASMVTLRVYDLLGREVKTLISQSYPAAGATEYQVIWDGKSRWGMRAASGVYFYRLEVQGASGKHAVEVKKMVLIK
jgi:serine protease AprX